MVRNTPTIPAITGASRQPSLNRSTRILTTRSSRGFPRCPCGDWIAQELAGAGEPTPGTPSNWNLALRPEAPAPSPRSSSARRSNATSPTSSLAFKSMRIRVPTGLRVFGPFGPNLMVGGHMAPIKSTATIICEEGCAAALASCETRPETDKALCQEIFKQCERQCAILSGAGAD
jgi:hypothetical protein